MPVNHPLILTIARLQLKLALQKRFILVLVALWAVHVSLVVQLGRAGASLVLSLLVPAFFVTDLLVIVLASGLIADDAEQDTFPFILSHGIERSTFLWGKLLMIVALAMGFALFAHVAILTLAPTQGPKNYSVLASQLVLAATMSFARIVAVASVTAFAAVLLVHRPAAAVAALGYAYGLPSIVHAIFQPRTPGAVVAESVCLWRDSFDRAAGGLFSGVVNYGAVAGAIVQPLAYAAVFAFLASRSLQRRDLTRAGI